MSTLLMQHLLGSRGEEVKPEVAWPTTARISSQDCWNRARSKHWAEQQAQTQKEKGGSKRAVQQDWRLLKSSALCWSFPPYNWYNAVKNVVLPFFFKATSLPLHFFIHRRKGWSRWSISASTKKLVPPFQGLAEAWPLAGRLCSGYLEGTHLST